MTSRALRRLVVFGLACLPAAASRAELALSLSGMPEQVAPGEEFDLDVDLVGALGLASYNVELIVSSSAGEPGVHAWFVGAESATSRYVFDPPPGNFLSAVQPPEIHDRVVLSDFLLTGGVDTIAGVNDRVGRATVGTSTDLQPGANLTVSVVSDSLELLGGDLNALPGVDALQADPPNAEVKVVPEPVGLPMVLAGLAAVAVRRRGRRDSR